MSILVLRTEKWTFYATVLWSELGGDMDRSQKRGIKKTTEAEQNPSCASGKEKAAHFSYTTNSTSEYVWLVKIKDLSCQLFF